MFEEGLTVLAVAKEAAWRFGCPRAAITRSGHVDNRASRSLSTRSIFGTPSMFVACSSRCCGCVRPLRGAGAGLGDGAFGDREVEVALHREARALPAYLRWATIDPSASSFPQSATMAFFVSVAACARLGHAFTTFPALSKNHDAWRVLAEIVYVVNGGAITVPLVELWRRLIDDYASEAVEPLKELAQERRDFAGCGIDLDLAARFPRELTRLLEEVVRRGLVVTSIRDHGAPWLAAEAPSYIFSKLALIGSLETVPVVQPFVEHPQWGVEAVNTIRAIQAR